MIEKPIDALKQFPVRKSKKQKESFRNAVVTYAEKLGYSVVVEKGSMGAQNVVIGNPISAKYLVTAHYDTPASIGLPNILTPCNPVTFVLYQILLVLFLFVVSIGVAMGVGLLSQSEHVALLVWYVIYFGLLLLMMVGPANKHNANDNTSGVVTVLETAVALPENARNQVCFVLFDLEEAGLIGSSSYRKTHKSATNNQIVLNLDCVGDGDEILFFPTKKLKKDPDKMEIIRSLNGFRGEKSMTIHEKGFATYPSDQKNFPYGVGIAAFRRRKGIGLYVDRIHTWRDTILEEENVNYLRDALLKLVQTSVAE